MFKQFKKSSRPPNSPFLQALSKRAEKIQRAWAGWMHLKTSHWNPRQQKCFLILICLLLGGMSLYSFLEVLRDDKIESTSFSLTVPSPIMPPRPLSPPPPEDVLQDTLLFTRFRKAMDSMQQTTKGRETVEKFMRERPGFMDSMAFAEKLLKQSFPH